MTCGIWDELDKVLQKVQIVPKEGGDLRIDFTHRLLFALVGTKDIYKGMIDLWLEVKTLLNPTQIIDRLGHA